MKNIKHKMQQLETDLGERIHGLNFCLWQTFK